MFSCWGWCSTTQLLSLREKQENLNKDGDWGHVQERASHEGWAKQTHGTWTNKGIKSGNRFVARRRQEYSSSSSRLTQQALHPKLRLCIQNVMLRHQRWFQWVLITSYTGCLNRPVSLYLSLPLLETQMKTNNDGCTFHSHTLLDFYATQLTLIYILSRMVQWLFIYIFITNKRTGIRGAVEPATYCTQCCAR